MLLQILSKIRKLEFIKNKKFVFLGLLSLLIYSFLGYFVDRSEFKTMLCSISILFICYVYLIKNKEFNTRTLLFLGILCRLVLLGTTPFLSQDFYRFIWDGRLVINGISPYEFAPNAIIKSVKFAQAKLLFDGMGNLSATHFSNYPPINQLLFAVAGLFSSTSIIGSIVVFRIQIILADIGIYFIGKRILRLLFLNENAILLYFLNPLVLIELTGNLHFEGVMIFFFLVGIYFLIQKKYMFSVVFISFSIATKLLPLLLLPMFINYLGYKKSASYFVSIIVLTVLYFVPFVSLHLISNYFNTVSLWFTKFEFNASFYYVIRAIGFYYKGYNIIGSVGKIMPLLLLAFISCVAFFKKNNTIKDLFSSFLLVLTVYFLQSTTVHPWYVINLVFIACFTKLRFPIVWSFTVFFSYYAYSNALFKENLLLVFIEYALVLIFIVFEIFYKKYYYLEKEFM